MILGRYRKQPIDVLDYPVDYSAWLDKINPPDIVVEHDVRQVRILSGPINNPIVVDRVDISSIGGAVWLSGGESGATYQIDCVITTQGGRTEEYEFIVAVKEI